MKTLILMSLSLLLTNAFAGDVPTACFGKAARAVEKENIGRHYDKDGFETFDCYLSDNNAAVICEVSAAKGDMAAYDTYRVVLNKKCSKVFRVEMTGEE